MLVLSFISTSTNPSPSSRLPPTMSDIIDLTLENPLSPIVLRDWLPIQSKPVFHLFQFNQYPANKTGYIIPSNFDLVLHEEIAMDFQYSTLPQLGLPDSPAVSEAYQTAIKSAKKPINSVTLIPAPRFGNPVTVPTWIFDYWRNMKLAISCKEQWKDALVWLRSHAGLSKAAPYCQDILLALSFFPWSGNNASVKDITSLLSECGPKSYLSDLHIDHMIEQTSASHGELCGPEISGRHVITSLHILGAITEFYGSRSAPSKTGNALWNQLMEIENSIIRGNIDSIGGVYYRPLHWVSVVFNIQKWCIHYGDSLGQPLQEPECSAFTKWIKHLKYRSDQSPHNGPVPVHSLPTGHQNDSTSCGLFALNAIDHYYLGSPLLPSDRMSLVLRWMEITLNYLHAKTVSVILNVCIVWTNLML